MRRAVPLIVAVALFTALCIAWIVSDRRASQRIYDRYSSANTSDDGLSLGYAYLDRHRPVAMLTRPLARVTLEPDAVVFRVTEEVPLMFDPEELAEKEIGPPRPKLRPILNDAEKAFVRRGGRIIVAAASGLLDTRNVEQETAAKVFPIWPSVARIDVPEGAGGFTNLRPRMNALFAKRELTVVARERIGAGELFVISSPELFTNEHLAGGNRLALLAALAGTNRPVYFDEVPHGLVSGDGALALMKEWNLGPFLLLIGVATVLVFWRGGRRVGPPEDEARETRSDAVDLVRSLGALYREVTSDAAAIALYYDALVRTVASQSGLRGDALRKRIDDLTGGFQPPMTYEDIPAHTFRRQLAVLNEAFAKVRGTR